MKTRGGSRRRIEVLQPPVKSCSLEVVWMMTALGGSFPGVMDMLWSSRAGNVETLSKPGKTKDLVDLVQGLVSHRPVCICPFRLPQLPPHVTLLLPFRSQRSTKTDGRSIPPPKSMTVPSPGHDRIFQRSRQNDHNGGRCDSQTAECSSSDRLRCCW